MSYTATGYYIDPDGRRGEFQVESPSSDRRQIERIVRNRYDADKVQINSVGLTPDPMAEQRERARREQETYDRERAEDRLEQPYTSSSSYSSSSSSSYSGGGGGNIGCGGFIALAALLLIGGLFSGDDESQEPEPEQPSSTLEAPAPAPVAPAPVIVPNRTVRPSYARTEPPVTPVWELEEDLTGNPDFTFND